MTHNINIHYKLSLKGRWHVGSGMGKGQLDRVSLMNGKGQPYIPGSMLKGVIRQSCEDIAQILGINVADPHDKTEVEGLTDSCNTTYIINKLFGSRYEGECLFFRNAALNGHFFPSLHLLPISRTKIDRLTGIAEEKRLFTTEYVESMEFESSIIGHHQGLTVEDTKLPFEYALLIAGIHSLKRVGGDKSTGNGKLKVDITSIEYNDNPMPAKEAFWIFSRK